MAEGGEPAEAQVKPEPEVALPAAEAGAAGGQPPGAEATGGQEKMEVDAGPAASPQPTEAQPGEPAALGPASTPPEQQPPPQQLAAAAAGLPPEGAAAGAAAPAGALVSAEQLGLPAGELEKLQAMLVPGGLLYEFVGDAASCRELVELLRRPELLLQSPERMQQLADAVEQARLAYAARGAAGGEAGRAPLPAAAAAAVEEAEPLLPPAGGGKRGAASYWSSEEKDAFVQAFKVGGLAGGRASGWGGGRVLWAAGGDHSGGSHTGRLQLRSFTGAGCVRGVPV